jgi:LSD1 subclass zinc finger protein
MQSWKLVFWIRKFTLVRWTRCFHCEKYIYRNIKKERKISQMYIYLRVLRPYKVLIIASFCHLYKKMTIFGATRWLFVTHFFGSFTYDDIPFLPKCFRICKRCKHLSPQKIKNKDFKMCFPSGSSRVRCYTSMCHTSSYLGRTQVQLSRG